MTEPLSGKFKKTLTRHDAADMLIRAQVPQEGGGFIAASFLRERIDYLVDLGPELSGIVLKTGAKIAVKMAYEALEQAVFLTDAQETPVLDLRSVTGQAAAEAALPQLRQDFAAQQPAAAARDFTDVPLQIAFFARQPQQQNFKMCVVKEGDIDWKSVEGHTDGKNGPYTKFSLLYGQGPFGGKDVMFDMPRPKFMELYNLAKMNGYEKLDIREWTRRRDPDNTPPPPPPPPSF